MKMQFIQKKTEKKKGAKTDMEKNRNKIRW